MANQTFRVWLIGKDETEDDVREISAHDADDAATDALRRWQNCHADYYDVDGDPVRVAVLDESGNRTTWLVRAEASIDYMAEEEDANDE